MENLSNEIIESTPVFTGQSMTQHIASPSALVTVDQARAIAEVQAAMVIARANPRDENAAYQRILKTCSRLSFAENARYAYRRGGHLIEDGNIRLAEAMAQAWGNLNYGFREIFRSGDSSEVEAFAWDLETNTRAVRQFHVKHWRDTQQGGHQLKEERDKYEIVANQAQRRVRACIFEIIPRDIKEAAEERIAQTVSGNGEKKIPEMLAAFQKIGVTKEMIEKRMGCNVPAIAASQWSQLRSIYTSIRDGAADISEFFANESKSEPQKNGDEVPWFWNLKSKGWNDAYADMDKEGFEMLKPYAQRKWIEKCERMNSPWPKEKHETNDMSHAEESSEDGQSNPSLESENASQEAIRESDDEERSRIWSELNDIRTAASEIYRKACDQTGITLPQSVEAGRKVLAKAKEIADKEADSGH